jgi:hypothetical protein
MKTIRVALTVAGALAALVGGAATASWGLTPLAGDPDAPAPQIVALDAAEHQSPYGGAPPSLDTVPAAYVVPHAPPADADPEGPRPDSMPSADNTAPSASSPADSDGPGAGANETSPAASTSPEEASPHMAAPGEVAVVSAGDAVSAGPD